MTSSKRYSCDRCGDPTSSRRPAGQKLCASCSRQKTRVDKNCEGCGAAFKAKRSQHLRGLAKYCSNACRYKFAKTGPDPKPRVALVCDSCGTGFERRASKAGTGPAYCNQQCYRRSLSPSVEKCCTRCGAHFHVTRSDHLLGRGKYCSKECCKEPLVSTFCLGCGSAILKQKKHVDRAKNGNFCTHSCWTTWNRQERVYNWAGGDPQGRDPFLERPWRKQVLIRDRWACQLCPSTEQLEVHHIFPYASHPEIRWDRKNGIALCRVCHQGLRGRELEEAARLRTIVDKNEVSFQWNIDCLS